MAAVTISIRQYSGDNDAMGAQIGKFRVLSKIQCADLLHMFTAGRLEAQLSSQQQNIEEIQQEHKMSSS
jgi:hypothetical protein